jgi:hypothetical protein
MFTLPLVVVVLGALMTRSLLPWLRARWSPARWVAYAGLALACLGGAWVARDLYAAVDQSDDAALVNLDFVSSLQHDEATVLVAPYDLPMHYIAERYPVHWSFTPYNRETLALLAARYRIGTVLLLVQGANPATELTGADLEPYGLVWQRQVEFKGRVYEVYQARSQ